jgi:type IV pilus assembly protein PilA
MNESPTAGRAKPRQRWGAYQIEALILAATLAVPALMLLLVLSATNACVMVLPEEQRHHREVMAIQSVKTIHTAEVQYQSQFGCYACSLSELGPPASGLPGASAADLIGSDLASGEKEGYKFALACVPAGYAVNAVPVSYGSSGNRSFYSDQTMIIRENDGPEPATAQSPELR